MNRWMSTDVDASGTTQFEGRTAEEAVARARAALGDSGALRCWKTRRGGVGGFFAREVFVAGLTPPPGSETTRGRASRAEPGQKRGAPERAPVAEGAPEDVTNAASGVGPVPRRAEDTSVWPEDHLAGLVEATSDQVSLGPLAIPSEAFDEVLAEAQAALTRRARRQRRRRPTRSRRSGTADCRPGGARRLRTSARATRRRPRRGTAHPSRRRHGPEEPRVAQASGATSGGTTRREGDPTQGEGPTHATGSAVQCDDARTARSTGAHAGPET